MIIVLIGPPGVGKGTQAKRLCDTLSLRHLSSGDILRQAVKEASPDSQLAKQLASGSLVDDGVVCQLILDVIRSSDQGCLLDGFPRTESQARFLADSGIAISHVVELDIKDERVVERISGRMVHASGRVYHKLYNPPKVEGLDDVTGEPLMVRSDDSADVVINRLAIYKQEAGALLAYYRSSEVGLLDVAVVDANQDIDSVTRSILKVVSDR
ncbi:MAG: adenylate kinase [Legionellales bacterium]|nr:adenylate kinase [Legionellales bacterium]|tara:strand:- start:167 stop:802 length:636 start_codon:yes stop_codon:yes gene_type:complete